MNAKRIFLKDFVFQNAVTDKFFFQVNDKKIKQENIVDFFKQFNKVFERLALIKTKKNFCCVEPKIFEVIKYNANNILKGQVTIKVEWVCYYLN